MYVEVLTERRKQLGDDHKDTIGSINNLAHLYKQQGKYADAEKLYVEALEG